MTSSGRRPGVGALGGALAALLVVVVAAACGDDPMGVQLERVEEVTYADAFVDPAGDTVMVDLSMMTETPSGVWTQDLVVGTGDTAQVVGDTLYVSYTGWVRDGTMFDSGEFSYTLGDFGSGSAIAGWHFGMAGQQEGGTRLVVIPPELAYGDRSAGPVIYPGAVLVFKLQLDSLHPWVGP